MAILNIVAYGVIPMGLLWVMVHCPGVRLPLAGLTLHMFIVLTRASLLAVNSDSLLWDWATVHRTTATIAAVCFLSEIVREKMENIKAAWATLDNTGRIVLIVAISIVIIAAIVTGFDLTPYITGLFN